MNTDQHTSISKIIIAGSGLEAWLTASFLLMQLGSKNIHLTVCPVNGSDELDPLYSVLPSSDDDLLQALGISNIDLVKHCQASFSLGSRYTGLSTSDFDQFRPYGNVGLDFLGGTFIHHWLRDKQNTGETPSSADYFSYSPGYQAGKRNAFAPPVKHNAIGSLQHQMARHVDVPLLSELLRNRALSMGATVTDGELSAVKRKAGDRIGQLITSTGENLQADLFIDCSGLTRSLAGDLSESSWVPARFSPGYQLTIKKEAEDAQPTPFNRVSALSSGWQVTNPGNGWNMTLDLLETQVTDEGLMLQPGYTNRPWVGNCLALGVAAAEILPVETLQTKTLVTSLKRLVQLLPGPDCVSSETMEFNYLFEQDLREVADISTLYELARQKGNIDSSNIENLNLTTSLKNRLSLFSKRGWVAPLDSHLLSRSDWTAVFVLLGLFPGQYDRIVERMPADQLKNTMRDLRSRIEKVAAEFPPHGIYLDAIKSSPESRA